MAVALEGVERREIAFTRRSTTRKALKMPSLDKTDHWTWLSNWYQSQCDGDWEHQHGIKIETIDNPGWWVEIDLARTALEGCEVAKVSKELSHGDWLYYEVADSKFVGAGDPSKLNVLVAAFVSLSRSLLNKRS